MNHDGTQFVITEEFSSESIAQRWASLQSIVDAWLSRVAEQTC